MFEVFAHANLTHQFVFVAVHSGQLADVGKNVLQPVRQLVRAHIAQPVLHMAVHD